VITPSQKAIHDENADVDFHTLSSCEFNSTIRYSTGSGIHCKNQADCMVPVPKILTKSFPEILTTYR
jgi:hypothetical protein